MAQRMPVMLLQLARQLPSITASALHPPPSCAQPLAVLQTCRSIATGRPIWAQAQPQPQQNQQGQQEQTKQHHQGQESSSQQGQQAFPGVDGEQVKQRVYGAFKSGYDGFRSMNAADGQAVLDSMAQEVRGVFTPTSSRFSATRQYTGPVMDPGNPDSGAALMLVKQRQTAWQKLHEKVQSSPWLAKLRGVKVTDTAAFKKGQQLVDDLKDKYDTSDHPIVHKVDEIRGRVMSGTDGSRAMLEVRMRDPSFDLNIFVRAIKMDAPSVIKAFLRHEIDTLKLHMGPEMLERLAGIYKHDADKGLYEDSTILFVSDVELVEMRVMEGDPFAVTQFHCQQLKCTRDKFGNVVDGSTDSIQRVFYFWGLQMEKQGVVTAEGQVLPPRWVIKDMVWQSMKALV